MFEASCWSTAAEAFDTVQTTWEFLKRGITLKTVGIYLLKILGPFCIKVVLRHLIFRGTKMGPQSWELPI